MSEPFVGEIRMFAGNFAPRGWAFCDGQLLAVSQNDALFSLYGTIYGGDGRTTFGLPDMRGRISIHQGQGPGLSSRPLGAKSGVEKVTLTENQMPSHSHAFEASTAAASSEIPTDKVLGDTSAGRLKYLIDAVPNTSLNQLSIDNTGGSQPHTNLQPTLCINYIVALFGIYPSRQ